MICDSCKVDSLFSDFINNQKFCYRCIYREKLSKSKGKRTQRSIFCRMCGKKIIRQKDAKTRHREVFCSSECAEEGHKQQLNTHWTRKFLKGHSSLKKRGVRWNPSQ